MPRPIRPIPEDFRVVAPGKTQAELAKHYRASLRLIVQWQDDSGIECERRLANHIPMPEDFPTMALTKSDAEIGRELGVSGHVPARWRRKLGLPASNFTGAGQEKPIPEDFERLCATMTRKEIAEHCGVSLHTVSRWVKTSGCVPVKGVPGPRYTRGKYRNPLKLYTMDTRRDCRASRAQSFLQRYVPVWRCSETGQFDPKGSHFRVDGIIRTEEEMIARAERKGFGAEEARWAA